jgi:hypothetical protein
VPLLVADARACCGRRRGGDEAWRKRRFERVQMEGTRDAPAARRQWHHKMTTRDHKSTKCGSFFIFTKINSLTSNFLHLRRPPPDRKPHVLR